MSRIPVSNVFRGSALIERLSYFFLKFLVSKDDETDADFEGTGSSHARGFYIPKRVNVMTREMCSDADRMFTSQRQLASAIKHTAKALDSEGRVHRGPSTVWRQRNKAR